MNNVLVWNFVSH